MTVVKLNGDLQNIAHEGKAESKIFIELYDSLYEIKEVKCRGELFDPERMSYSDYFVIKAEPIARQ